MNKIRVLIGMLGLDQHELGAIAVARMLRDAGMEVIYAGRFNRPATIVKTTIEEDIDIIGLSCHSWEYLYYLPELFEQLKLHGIKIPVVVGGSVVTPGDAAQLMKMGVAAIFGPGSSEQEIVESLRRLKAGSNAPVDT